MTITLFDRAMDLVRYHGIWSLEVISKHLGLDDGALDAYCRRFPQARELYQTAREEFRTYMAQNALQRIFQLLDNPRADSRAKAALLTKLLEKFHPDMADKVEVKSTSLQDNRIQVVITDHSRPSASTPTPLPVSVAVEPPVAGVAEPPTPIKVEVYGPPVTTKTDEEIERALKSKNPGLALFSPNHRA